MYAAIFSPRRIVRSRSPGQNGEAIGRFMFVTANKSIRRFDTETDELTTVQPKNAVLEYCECYALECTASGLLLFSSLISHSIFSLEPISGEVCRIAGLGMDRSDSGEINGDSLEQATFDHPFGLYLSPDEQTLFVLDGRNGLRSVTL